MHILVRIMGGIPGSGKTTRANEFIDGAKAFFTNSVITVCSADNFFVKPDGAYVFDAKKISDAHKHCMQTFIDALYNAVFAQDLKTHVIVVDNTNTELWEFESYVKVALIVGARVQLDRLQLGERSSFGDVEPSVEACAERNTHGVPLEACQRMFNRWRETSSPEVQERNPWLKKVQNVHEKNV